MTPLFYILYKYILYYLLFKNPSYEPRYLFFLRCVIIFKKEEGEYIQPQNKGRLAFYSL